MTFAGIGGIGKGQEFAFCDCVQRTKGNPKAFPLCWDIQVSCCTFANIPNAHVGRVEHRPALAPWASCGVCACVCVCALLHGGSSSTRCCNKCKKTKRELISFFQLVTAANGAAAVRCRLQHSEGAARRMLRTANIGVCDIREAAARERAASTAGNRPLFYFRFGEHDECIFSSPYLYITVPHLGASGRRPHQ